VSAGKDLRFAIALISLLVVACSQPNPIDDKGEVGTDGQGTRQSRIASHSCRSPTDIAGAVTRVSDGDTFQMRTTDARVVTIRLAEVDAPENGQPWSRRARQTLTEFVIGKGVCARVSTTDRYGRSVARVFAGDIDVSEAMVATGAAWAYRRYLTDNNLLVVERRAREAGIGLWSMPDNQTMPPWEFRAQRRRIGAAERDSTNSRSPNRSPPHSLSGYVSCDLKPRCRELTSCAEARDWMRRCGADMLDGDGDGIPCERICLPSS
jgi:endonuclease YncB( thermonuclease family)